ncbi:MAG: Gfo/Idh/MocA family oxidoreductase [Planctomycetes bacterium]|nr:Gfo/Idh/MocA family oxidoreductase [Planctomycetota bacterium]
MEKPTVAIVGASGVGKHHAKWFHLAGCEVVAFAGTSTESCEKTAAALREVFPFQGRGYSDLGELLSACRPRLAAVCTPPQLHVEHVVRCLEAGCEVLCEKPLYWECGQPTAEQMAEVERALTVSARTRPFAVNLQFAAGVGPYLEVYRQRRGNEPGEVREFFAHLSPRPGRQARPPEWYWNDMGPHALSLLLGFAPDAELMLDTIDCRVGPSGTSARFCVRTRGGECPVEIEVAAPVGGQAVRRFGVNGLVVDYVSRSDAAGQFRTYLVHEGREWVFEDFMKSSIERFIDAAARGRGRPFVSAQEAARNLRMQLEVFDRARRVTAGGAGPTGGDT